MKFNKKKLSIAIGVLLSASSINYSYAEEVDESAKDNESGVQTIIVTASKKSESLQEAAISITAFSETDLELMGATDLLDFAVKVPNLAMSYEADGRFDSSSPAIRGVFGSNTTGFYIDDTPVNASILPRVMDIERIEVLRGPQGSLYGAKSMGGTIRMITVKPSFAGLEGKIHFTGSTVKEGDTNTSFDASVNIPISDSFAIRATGYYGQNSGIFDREYQSTWVEASSGATIPSPGPAFERRENVDDEEYYGGQITGLLEISENLTFMPKYIFQKVDADGLPFADREPDNTTELRFFDLNEKGSDEWSILSGTFDWSFAAGEITSTTALYERKTDESEEETHFLHFLFNEVIGIPIDPIPSLISTIEEYKSVTHETRFTTDYDDNFNFTVGVFYSDLDFDHHYPRAVQTGLANAIDTLTGAPGLGQDPVNGFGLTDDDLIFATTTETITKEKAVFGEITYDFNDIYSLVVGGRFYETKVSVVNEADGFANGGPTSFDDKQSETGFNPKILLKAQVNEDVNVYTTASKGFRVGGVNGNLPATLCGAELAELGLDPTTARTYDSDSLWSYEAGVKTSLADNTVTLNAAAYFISWSDVQQLNRLACGFQFTQNAGEAESKGLELEMQAVPMDGLNLSLGIGYTNAEITDSGGVAGVSKGDKIQGVPDWTLNASAQYTHDLSDGWEMMYRVDANHYGDSFSSNNESTAADQRLREAWSAVNLRVGLLSSTWEIILFAENLTDERASLADSRSIAAETPGRQRLVVTRPRTIGIEARMRF